MVNESDITCFNVFFLIYQENTTQNVKLCGGCVNTCHQKYDSRQKDNSIIK